MTPEELKAKLVSHGSTPEEHARVTIRKFIELLEGLDEDTTAEKQRVFMTERFESAQAETLAAVSHVLDEITNKWGYRSWGELRALAKALRGEEG